MAKRRCLFTKYQFEIGVLTLPIYIIVFAFGVVIFSTRYGQAVALMSALGLISSVFSLKNGYKEIEW